jgi:hypothetical protein
MKLTRNQFVQGRNTDTDPSKLEPSQYVEGFNFEMVGDGKYFAPQNLLGTTKVRDILVNPTVEELGTFQNKYLIGGQLYNCLTIFTVTPSNKFNIWCYNTESTILYALYEESVDANYLTPDRIISAENYPENGVDFLYFTDFLRELRFIKCEIPSTYSPNFLTSYDISLLRKGANGTIVLDDVDSGGNLLTGSYQFSYRMADPINKRFTKWSSLTNPIHVYKGSRTSALILGEPVYAGIGLMSDSKITLNITPSKAETDNFDYLQLAVIENVSTTPTTASLLEIQPIPGTTLTFEYLSNTKIGTIPVEDITVDLAQIETVKSLKVKENRLFGANVKYTDLELDNGTPIITSGSIINKVSSTVAKSSLYYSDTDSSKFKGYWRDEVYRFGAVFSDANGNTRMSPLDLSNITDNRITAGLTDMKFPDRSFSSAYTIWDSSSRMKALGLSLIGITNIPSWAVSLEIVRVERKGNLKNILFQTPIIPMMSVDGTGAVSDYPTVYYNGINDNTVTDAQPMTSGTVWVPKNLFIPELRNIKRRGSSSGSSTSYKTASDVYYVRNSTYDKAAIFPSDSMYNLSSPFVYTGVEIMDVVDYALLKVDSDEYRVSGAPTGVYHTGDLIETSISGTFHALRDSQYYFDSAWSGKSIPSTLKNIPLTDYEFFDNFGEGASVGGSSVLKFDELQTSGIGFWQYKPNTQRMGVVEMQKTISEQSLVFSVGTLNAVGNGNSIMNFGGIDYNITNRISNDYVTDYPSFSTSSSYISAVPIANIKAGLTDNRYGDINSTHEYISTGAKYTFSEAEIATLEGGGNLSINLDVWGGDCFISSHIFKVCDSTYSIVNNSKNYIASSPDTANTSALKWQSVYLFAQDGTDPVICQPVAVKNSAQYVQVVLESDYNGEAKDIDIIEKISSVNRIPLMGNTTEASLRTPLTYKYNPNLNISNYPKVYVPKPLYSFEQNYFRARIIYTDLKIYNSDQAGFDIVRASNFHDLEESPYDIIKLAIAGDSMYAIQERRVTYIPTGERQIETTDAGQLAVRSGDVIGRTLTVDLTRGSQHSRGIIETGSVVLIPDNFNKSVYMLSGTELKTISEGNDTIFRSLFGNKIPERDVVGIYDPVRLEYWLVIDGNCQVFSEKIGAWVGQYEFINLKSGVYQDQRLFLNGRVGDSLSIYTMHTGDVNTLFDTVVVPRITFYVNPDESISKTFEVMMVDASDRLDVIDLEVERESSLGNQVVNGTNLDSISIEGNYRVKTPRATGNAKLRGLRMKATIKWGELRSALRSVWTKYNLSARSPF